jgi:hypothetical protein
MFKNNRLIALEAKTGLQAHITNNGKSAQLIAKPNNTTPPTAA